MLFDTSLYYVCGLIKMMWFYSE